MKYKLLKDLPWISAGTIFAYKKADSFWVELVNGTTVGGLLKFIKWFGIDNDFFEPIVEKKRFEDLREGDTIYFIGTNWHIASAEFSSEHVKSEVFSTRKDAEMEALRREARANQEWIPEVGEKYYSVSVDHQIYDIRWYDASGDISDWHMGNVHKTEEDAEKWNEKYYEAFFVKPFKK